MSAQAQRIQHLLFCYLVSDCAALFEGECADDGEDCLCVDKFGTGGKESFRLR
jgi:hypothetical protein